VLRLRVSRKQRAEVEAVLEEFEERAFARRLWERDPSLWNGDTDRAATISKALGRLAVAEETAGEADALTELADEVRSDGVRHLVLLGAGGTSPAPEALAGIFGPADGYPDLRVLDSTDPDAVLAIQEGDCLERRARFRCCPRGCRQRGPLDLHETLFILNDMPGGSIETTCLHTYFRGLLQERLGERAGSHLVAITEAGSRLATAAAEQGFRAVFLDPVGIGGPWSALSLSGMVPAALMGLDVTRLLDAAMKTAAACAPHTRCADAPPIVLGAALGSCARRGRDKLTLLAPEALAPLGAWIEQLVAASTGKDGRGILPVDLEPVGRAETYGDDRLFVHLQLAGEDDGTADLEERVEAVVEELVAAGHPVVTISLPDRWAVGGQLLLWEIATLVAASVLGVDPFDQSDARETTDRTGSLLHRYAESGMLPAIDPPTRTDAATGYDDAAEVDRKKRRPVVVGVDDGSAATALAGLMAAVRPGDYVCLQAYVAPSAAVGAALDSMRRIVRDRLRVATTAGYGSRFLHGAGQYHKNGPDTGVYVQLVADHRRDLPIPGRGHGFAVLQRAQADADLESLRSRDRRILRVELGRDMLAGLRKIVSLFRERVPRAR
jgi:hypothetical protein